MTSESTPVTSTNSRPIASALEYNNVVVHPLFLLNVVDHYVRASSGRGKRCVGAIVGEVKEGDLHLSNSFAVPFEEDRTHSEVNFLDGLYYQQMAYMFKKINTREVFVGWYSTGTSISAGDLDLDRRFREFAGVSRGSIQPVFCLVNVTKEKNVSSLPVKVYHQSRVPHHNDQFISTFTLFGRCEIKGSEAEEVAVEHLVRDIKDSHAMSFKGNLQGHHGSIKEYADNLTFIRKYLDDVSCGNMPANQKILTSLAEIESLLPRFDQPGLSEGATLTADQSELMHYVGSLTMAVMSLHDLVDNRCAPPSQQSGPEAPKSKPKKRVPLM